VLVEEIILDYSLRLRLGVRRLALGPEHRVDARAYVRPPAQWLAPQTARVPLHDPSFRAGRCSLGRLGAGREVSTCNGDPLPHYKPSTSHIELHGANVTVVGDYEACGFRILSAIAEHRLVAGSPRRRSFGGWASPVGSIAHVDLPRYRRAEKRTESDDLEIAIQEHCAVDAAKQRYEPQSLVECLLRLLLESDISRGVLDV
jgi:hypothetical protein